MPMDGMEQGAKSKEAGIEEKEGRGSTRQA